MFMLESRNRNGTGSEQGDMEQLEQKNFINFQDYFQWEETNGEP